MNQIKFYLFWTLLMTISTSYVYSEDYLLYYFNEESPADTRIGELINDYGLNKKYNQTVLDSLRFTILMQPNFDEPYIAVDERTGLIKATSKIDREKVCPRSKSCTIKFDVAVKPTQYFEIVKIKVDIQDINDNFPTFPERRLYQVMSEAAEIGSGFVIPAAVDLDSDKYGIQRYKIFPANGKFELKIGHSRLDGETDLRLVLREKLDRGIEERYQVNVYAVDGGDPPKTGSIIVDITIQDANDNNPEFENVTYEVSVLENLPIGTILTKVKANDNDLGSNGVVTYKFSKHTVHEYGHLFGIKSDTGKVFLKDLLDYETDNIHLLSVAASDQGPDSLPGHTSVVVRVLDVNDNPPTISVNTLTTEGHANVVEHSPLGTFVAHVSVLDQDSGENGRVNCYIDSNLFHFQQMYQTEFKLITATEFDRERQNRYDVMISCKDNGDPSLTSEAKLNIHITDTNDHAPIFRSNPINENVQENAKVGTEVMMALADDEDMGKNAQVVYSISDNVIDYLYIDHVTGLITTNRVFDREHVDTLIFNITAHDRGEPQLSSYATIILTVIDENDERTLFPIDRYTFTVEENQPIETVVGKVTAVDRDLSPHDSFTYFIEKGDEVVEVDQKTGILKTKVTFDREVQSSYQVIVIAASEDDQLHSATATVTINISDINDNRPIFKHPENKNETVAVSSFATTGHVMTHIKAIDADTGLNANISYYITAGNKRQLLTLDQHSGALKVNSRLSAIEFEDIFLVLTAKDGGTPQQSSEAELRVVISKDIAFPISNGGSSLRQTILENEDTVIFLAVAFAAILVAITIITGIIIVLRTNSQRRETARKGAQQNTTITTPNRKMNNGNDKLENRKSVSNANSSKRHYPVSLTNELDCKYGSNDDVTNRLGFAVKDLPNGLSEKLNQLESLGRNNFTNHENIYANHKISRGEKPLKPVVAFVTDKRENSGCGLSEWAEPDKGLLLPRPLQNNGMAFDAGLGDEKSKADEGFASVEGLYEPVLPRCRGQPVNSCAGTLSSPARYEVSAVWSSPERCRGSNPNYTGTFPRQAQAFVSPGSRTIKLRPTSRRSNSTLQQGWDLNDPGLFKSNTANNFQIDNGVTNDRTDLDPSVDFDLLQNDLNFYKNSPKCNMFLM